MEVNNLFKVFKSMGLTMWFEPYDFINGGFISFRLYKTIKDMKYLKRFNENSVRLAADLYLNSKEGDWISGINDPFTIRYCNIVFPDGGNCSFGVVKEDIGSEFLNLKVSNTESRDSKLFEDFYICVFGDNIQFESLNEYKFVRKYLNKEDLLEHSFDSYIYSDNFPGPFEVSVKILNTIPLNYGRGCIIEFYNNATRVNIMDYVRNNKNWKSDIRDFVQDQEKMQSLYTFISDYEDQDKYEVSSNEISTIQDLKIDGLLYLWYILSPFSIKEVATLKVLLKNHNGKIKLGDYLKILEEFI
jgi:hypothetical protein